MTTTAGRVGPRAAFVVQKKSRSIRSVRVRQSTEDNLSDESDVESYTQRNMRRGKRRSVEEGTSSRSTRRGRPLRRRQIVAPAPAPAPEEDDEEDDDEDEDEGEDSEDDDASDSSSDSSASDALDGVESDDSDSDADSIAGEEETASQTIDNPASATENPGFRTLVPGASAGPSQPAGPAPEETLSSSSVQPTLTTTTRPTQPEAEPTSVPTTTLLNEEPIPDSDETSTIIQAPSTITNAGDSSAATGDAVAGEPTSGQVGDGNSSRGADIGIVFGTLAIAGLLIAAGIFFYRKRKQSNKDHLERLPDEKSLPPDPPTFQLSAPPPARVQRSQSSIMDQAIGAVYQNEQSQGYQQNNLSSDFQPVRYEQAPVPAPAAGRAPMSPMSPGANYNSNNNNNNSNLSPSWTPAIPRTELQQQQQMSNFQHFPASNPRPAVPPPPMVAPSQGQPFMGAPPGIPPGAFQPNLGQPRMSMAQTETTEGAGTWSTFAPERMRANGGKLPLKERVLGHF